MKGKKYRKFGIGAGAFLSVVFSVFVGYLLISGYFGDSVVVKYVQRELRPVDVVGEASLVDGATKVMYIMHYPYQASPGTAYASNLSNATAFEFYDYLDNEMTGETPSGTAFDVVIKVAINTTHGWNATLGAWDLDLHNSTLNGVTGYGFTVNVAMEEQKIANGTSWNFVHYYLQDADGGAGTGFQIGQNVATNATFEFWAYQ